LERKVPTRTLELPGKDWKFLNKLLLLHNILMQHHVIPYEEVFIRFEHILEGGEVIPTAEKLVYFEPDSILLMRKTQTNAYTIYKILDNYIQTGILTHSQMIVCNNLWIELKEKAR
jgi:hypothetical protein